MQTANMLIYGVMIRLLILMAYDNYFSPFIFFADAWKKLI